MSAIIPPPITIEQLQTELAEAQKEVRQLREFINYIQVLGTSAEGNIKRMNKEMQTLLKPKDNDL